MSVKGVLVLVSAVWCGHCKVLLNGNGSDKPLWTTLRDDPELRQLIAFKHYETVGPQQPQLDPPSFIKDRVKGFPMMFLIPLPVYQKYFTNIDLNSTKPDQPSPDAPKSLDDFAIHMGQRTLDNVKGWATRYLSTTTSTQGTPVPIKTAHVPPSPAIARQLPTSKHQTRPPHVEVVINQRTFIPANEIPIPPQKRKVVFVPRRV